MPPHLTDEALNEYLDAALPPDERADAAAHLKHCLPCTTRLDALRALFTDLAALPDLPLTRDLAPAVLKALPAQAPAPTRARRPAGPWLLGAQLIVAVVIGVLAWPLLATSLATITIPTDLAALATGWLTRLPAFTPAAWLADAQSWLFSLLPNVALNFDFGTTLTPLLIGAAVAGAAALWLVGNALLLRRSLTTLIRRRA